MKLAAEVAQRFDAMLADHDYSVEFLEIENRLATYILNLDAVPMRRVLIRARRDLDRAS